MTSNLNDALEYVKQLDLSCLQCVYIAVAVLLPLIIFRLLIRKQPKNIVAYSTDNGRVMVSRQAIVDLVQTSCEQLQDVSKPQVRISSKGNITHFEIRIKLLSGGQLRQIEQTLQSHLRKALTENLGIERLGRINIVATGFKSGRIDSSIQAKLDSRPNRDTAVEGNSGEELKLEPEEDKKTL